MKTLQSVVTGVMLVVGLGLAPASSLGAQLAPHHQTRVVAGRALERNTIQLGQWHHFVGAYNATTDVSRIYLAGTQAAMGTQGPFVAADGDGSIGTWDGCTPCNQFYKGRIDEVRVSSVERSAHWIATSYANINNPSTFAMTGAAEDVR